MEKSSNKLFTCPVINYMDGISYNLTPLLNLRMIAASSIRGEPSYYQTNKENIKMFDKAVKSALDYDYEAVLKLAVELREQYGMRLNPQVIIMIASLHTNRPEFCKNNPLVLKNAILDVAKIPTDIYSQFEYYIKKNNEKNKLPGIIKRAWASYFENLGNYQAAKYLHKAHLKNLINICHPNPKKNPLIDEIIKTGKVKVDDSMKTWENLRSAGKNWFEIFTELKTLPHMALLRNLSGICNDESVTMEFAESTIGPMLKKGVLGGKQFPFQYFSAYKSLNKLNDSSQLKTQKQYYFINILEECLQISIEVIPILKGKTIALCDNSGSARGSFTSEYGSVTVSEIANLSGLITVLRSEKGGKVGIFGDNLKYYDVEKDVPILKQLEKLNAIGNVIGQSTEGGIWIHFQTCCLTSEFYDNKFIYSDMQAGHGKLYGKNPEEYVNFRIEPVNILQQIYIDVSKLIEAYRQMVNPKVNVFSVQVAGYNNNLVPENKYRTSIMQGWTGKEALYASELIKIWDEAEK